MADDVWNARAVPALEAVHAAEEAERPIGTSDVARAVGLADAVAARTIASLIEAGYVTGVDVSSKDHRYAYIDLRLLERGRRAIGVWPTNPADGFVLAINRLIAAENDEETRGRL